ncbi:tRNA(Ile)-lysidine synthetase [Roseivivax isoporae LMG 25204]|uniref:tRNA(Ile)-lysidine synthase n=2 Tax=Roseivivax TaxID=93682 RepID=X7FBC8_9RHOB|nr:tRNA(Ile)-lysidine synthetase [Roseivivax isoporae LMG 25204]
MAMLALAHNWTRRWGVALRVVTVDHGLRPESAAEARLVAAECAALGHPHATLRWHWDGRGNVMDAARRARIDLIARWCGSIRHVLFAHTADDVAETFLMRLARGAGVDGLSAMAPARRVGGFTLVRPCLDMGREELRHYARTLRVPWVDDPTNEDPAYDRTRMRRLVALMAAEGLGADTLAAAAGRMRRARRALEARTRDLARAAMDAAAPEGVAGALTFDRGVVEASDRETQVRLVAAALTWTSGAEYRPRGPAVEALVETLLSGGRGTLHGAEAECGRRTIRVWRDFAAVRHVVAAPGPASAWDGRHQIDGAGIEDCEVRALGVDGWAQIPAHLRENPPEGAPPLRIARACPALWRDGALAGFAPMGFGPAHAVRDRRSPFTAFLLSD